MNQPHESFWGVSCLWRTYDDSKWRNTLGMTCYKGPLWRQYLIFKPVRFAVVIELNLWNQILECLWANIENIKGEFVTNQIHKGLGKWMTLEISMGTKKTQWQLRQREDFIFQTRELWCWLKSLSRVPNMAHASVRKQHATFPIMELIFAVTSCTKHSVKQPFCIW